MIKSNSLLLIILVLFFACSPYQSSYKSDVVSDYLTLNDLPESSADFALENIEFHCEFAQDGLDDYANDVLIPIELGPKLFIQFHYSLFRVGNPEKPINQIDKFMNSLYAYCNLEEEFNIGWTSVDELEEIYINEYKY